MTCSGDGLGDPPGMWLFVEEGDIYGYIVFSPPCKEKLHFHPVACCWVCSKAVGWQCWEQGVRPRWERLCSEKGQEESGRLVATWKCWIVCIF